MHPDPYLKEYKRIYRHDKDDSRADYQLFAEMREPKPNFKHVSQFRKRYDAMYNLY